MENEKTAQDSSLALKRSVVRAIAIVGAFAVVASHLWQSDQQYPDQARVCAGLLGAMALISFAFMPYRTLPALPIFLTHFYFAMGYPTFSERQLKGVMGPIRISGRAMDEASLGTLVFACAMVVATIAVAPLARRISGSVASALDPPPSADGHTVSVRILAGMSVCLYIVMALRGASLLGPMAFAGTLFASPAVSLSLLFWDFENTKTLLARGAFWGAMSVLAVIGLATGMIGEALTPGLTAAVLLWTVRGKIPVQLFVGGLALLLVFSPAKYVYRALTWSSPEELGIAGRAANWAEALERTYGRDNDDLVETSTDKTKSRVDNLTYVAQIFDWVPGRVPYAGPDLWLEAPLELVPRVFWPEKPSHAVAFNRAYTVAFDLQTGRADETTTLNLPSVGDGFWRLGWTGVVLEGTLLGLLTGFFQGLTRASSLSLLMLGSGFIIWTQPDRHAFQALGGLPQFGFVVVAVLLTVRFISRLRMGSVGPVRTDAQPRPTA